MRSVLAVVVAASVSMAAGGCHHAPTPAPEASSSAAGMASGSPADVRFLEDMVIHHQQSLELAALVFSQSGDPALVAFADQSSTQQRTELQGCQAQLLQWEVPGGHSGREHAAEIPGMVDTATIDKLRGLRGPAFDTLWLQTMIAHQRGAIALAQNEIQHGESPEAISIAQSLLPFQQAEINQMNQLLGAP
ncbi:DUF305 domain-containing protein [[Mycobacterium] holstebronense]|uniref:DUF305 domain-containing protein n=1 Tax=[Mycobacterium] holstebronense TaxID=3064288 RepID=A0ABM9LBN0_9MYCO|nr:DUF305 domain-containing protein [Mycolicibacter sp. MU0102]CAJ1496210.1 DUF305 domain-containing protein [Mycolicibacter sp. MU0102]